MAISRKHGSSDEIVSVAKAKANFSALISGVQRRQGTVTIVRRGIPVARVVPIEQKAFSIFGAMRGSVSEHADIVGPTGEEWTVGDE